MLEKVVDFLAIFTVGFASALLFLVDPMQKENAELRAQLDDPHHCISYVAENIEQICGDCYAE